MQRIMGKVVQALVTEQACCWIMARRQSCRERESVCVIFREGFMAEST